MVKPWRRPALAGITEANQADVIAADAIAVSLTRNESRLTIAAIFSQVFPQQPQRPAQSLPLVQDFGGLKRL
jgi:hypothetical protein